MRKHTNNALVNGNMKKITLIQKFTNFLIIYVLLLCFVNSNINAQTEGKIIGVVSDSSNNTFLPGANVIVEGTAKGAASDLDGEYIIFNVPPGKHTLKAMYLGYSNKVVEIELKSGQSLRLDFQLLPATIIGEEVLVTAQREGQLAAINQQLQSDQLINVVSAERMRQVPDQNAAESISRLPGISMKRSSGEGQGVVIRGLSPKYNTVKLNGVDFASSNSEDRGADLSFITTESLDGIEVYKSITADMDADNIGGAVNLKMSKAKIEGDYEVRLYGAYNEMENDLAQFRTFGLASDRVFNNQLGIQASINAERRNRGRDLMRAKYFQKDLPTNPDGSDAGIYYEIRQASIEDKQEIRSRYGGSLTFDGGNENNQFVFSNILNYSEQDILIRTHRYDAGDGAGTVQPEEIEKNSYSLINTLEGMHDIGQLKVDWNLGHAYSKGSTPFHHLVGFRESNVGVPDVKLNAEDFLATMPTDSTASFYNAEYFTGFSEERRLSASVNLQYPYNLGKKISGFLKGGGKYTKLDRKNEEKAGHVISSELDEQIYIEDWLDPNYDPGAVLNGRTELGLITDPSLNRPFYEKHSKNLPIYAGDSPFYGSNNNYEADEAISAGYFMGQFKFTDIFTFTPGIRYESENSTYYGYYRLIKGNVASIDGDYYLQSEDRKNDYWFPMLNLKIKPLEFFDLRLSYTETISRPNYLWLVPRESRVVQSNRISVGMPSLKPAFSANYDISLSFYDSKFGFFSVGYFYKEIDDFSYALNPLISDEGDALNYNLPATEEYIGYWVNTYINTPNESIVRGIEIDVQPNLMFLPGFLSGFVIHANLTLINSDSWLTKKEVVGYDPIYFSPIYDIGFRNGPMPNQAEYISNLSLGYDIGGFSARVSLFLQGESLDGIGLIESEDSYVDEFRRIDFTLKMDITDNLTLYLNGVNVTNEPDAIRQAQTTKYRMVEYYGAMYDFGLGYRF